ncbi:MAG: mechanosensitive ion channel family protein [Phycisphaerales bacterium JB040]
MTTTPIGQGLSLPSTDEVTEQAAEFLNTWGVPLLWLAVVVLAGLVLHWIVFAVLTRATREKDGDTHEPPEDERVERVMRLCVLRMRRPALLVPALLGVQLVTPAFADRAQAAVSALRHANSILLVVLLTWMVLAVLNVITQAVLDEHDTDVDDNLRARSIHTQLRVMKRVLTTIVVIIGGAAVLMTFPSVREFGQTLLASAGLAGLVLGLAARPVLENLFAGVQVALTQPIRLDDVVVIDGEWGRIEEITTTYVVVRIWDQRRLIVPFSKILGDSFTNWTRRNSEILGTAMIWADYTVPVREVRAALERYVQDHPKWDKRAVGLQVTEATERSIGMRALVSARSASDAWDLRCDVREHLIDYLQREHPKSLPREREEEYRQGQRATDDADTPAPDRERGSDGTPSGGDAGDSEGERS